MHEGPADLGIHIRELLVSTRQRDTLSKIRFTDKQMIVEQKPSSIKHLRANQSPRAPKGIKQINANELRGENKNRRLKPSINQIEITIQQDYLLINKKLQPTPKQQDLTETPSKPETVANATIRSRPLQSADLAASPSKRYNRTAVETTGTAVKPPPVNVCSRPDLVAPPSSTSTAADIEVSLHTSANASVDSRTDLAARPTPTATAARSEPVATDHLDYQARPSH